MLNEYLNKLKELLDSNNIADKDSFIEYFEEMVKDRLDAGQTEEEILSLLEKPEIIVKTLKEENGTISVSRQNNDQESTDEKSYTFTDVENLEVELVFGEVEIFNGGSDHTTVKVIGDINDVIEVECHSGDLIISQEKPNHISFGWPFAKNSQKENIHIIVELANGKYDELEFSKVSGVNRFMDLNFKDVSIQTVSGEVNITSCIFDELEIESVSAKVNATSLVCDDSFSSESVSGQLNIQYLTADSINIETVSGSVNLLIEGNKDDYYTKISRISKEDKQNHNGRKTLEIETVSGKISYDFTN